MTDPDARQSRQPLPTPVVVADVMRRPLMTVEQGARVAAAAYSRLRVAGAARPG
jgi:hypothetical protein